MYKFNVNDRVKFNLSKGNLCGKGIIIERGEFSDMLLRIKFNHKYKVRYKDKNFKHDFVGNFGETQLEFDTINQLKYLKSLK